MAVGVFDSGLGGLTVHKAIRQLMPDLPLQYYSDNAHAPYGPREPDYIFRLTQSATKLFWDSGCDLVVLACNTASAIALRKLQTQCLPRGKHVLGVFVPMIEVLTQRDWSDSSPPREGTGQQVALFATAATVASGAFQRELSTRVIGMGVEAQACSGLVEAIESGDERLAQELVIHYVQTLKKRMPSPQAAVLGCTHYPLLQPIFQRALGANVRIDSQARVVAESLKEYLRRHPERLGRGVCSAYTCSGDSAETSRQASDILGVEALFKAL